MNPIKYQFVECDNCGALYYLYADNTPDFPKLHTVCTICFMPMEIVNPFHKTIKGD